MHIKHHISSTLSGVSNGNKAKPIVFGRSETINVGAQQTQKWFRIIQIKLYQIKSKAQPGKEPWVSTKSYKYKQCFTWEPEEYAIQVLM